MSMEKVAFVKVAKVLMTAQRELFYFKEVMLNLITGRIRYQSLSAVDKTLFSQNVIGDLLSFSNLPRVKYEIRSDDIDAGNVLIESVKDSVDDDDGQ